MKLKTMETIHSALRMKLADYKETYNEAKKQLKDTFNYSCNEYGGGSPCTIYIEDSIDCQELKRFANAQWNYLCEVQDALNDFLEHDFH